MADVTVFAPPPIVVEVIAGSPPADQSAEIAALTQQLADANAEIEKLNGKIADAKAAAEAEKAADEASVAGQGVLDALA